MGFLVLSRFGVYCRRPSRCQLRIQYDRRDSYTLLPSALFQGVKSRAVKELSENSRYLLFHDARAVIFYYNAIVVFVYLVNLNKNIRKYAALFAGIECVIDRFLDTCYEASRR